MDQPASAAPQPEQGVDISKKTLIMLVMLSCIISLVGTVAMIYQFSTTQVAPTIIENNGASSAQAGFMIAVPEQPQSASVGANGFATFRIGE
jgi:type IV secretory pathway TrbF-like protein